MVFKYVSSLGCTFERMFETEMTTRLSSEWTPTDDNTARTRRATTERRHSTRDVGTCIDAGWFDASAARSVNDTAEKMSNRVATFNGIRLLIVLKYHSIVFVLSREKTLR